MNNDFHQTHNIFSLFDGLEVRGIDETLEVGKQTNGTNGIADPPANQVNGTHLNGMSALSYR